MRTLSPLFRAVATGLGCFLLTPLTARAATQGFQARPAAIAWTFCVVAASLLGFLVFSPTRWKAAAGWMALALAGQACSLQLLQVGGLIKLQEFYGWSLLLKSYQGFFLIALFVQTAVVAGGILRRRSKIRSVAKYFLRWPAAIVLLILEGFVAITIAVEVAQALVHGGFAHQAAMHLTKVALGLLILVVGALNLILAVETLPIDGWESLCAWWERADRRRLPLLCAAWVVIVSSLLAWIALDRIPHVPDEVAYLAQAKYIATGHLTLPLPPDAKSFAYPFAFADGNRWYGSAPAGVSFALAVGVLAGLPWLVNPLLGGIAVLLSHRWVRELYDRDVADGVALLLAFSPWLLFLSASLMPHPLSLVLSLLGLLGVLYARRDASIAWACIAGLGFGALLHVRALEAVIVTVVAGFWWLGAGWKKLRIAALAATCICGLTMAALYLEYNKALTGEATSVPINKYEDQVLYKGANRLGFGPEVGNFGWRGLDALPGHGPIDVMMNTNQNAYFLNFEMFGWSCGSMLFVFLLIAWGKWQGDALMWALILATLAAMSLYWFSGGPDFGARYWYQMVAPLAVLTVRGAQEAKKRLADAGVSEPSRRRVWAFMALASLLGVVNLLPWRSLDKYHNYRGMRADIRRLENQYHFGRSLVFVKGPDWPDYASAASFNPPTLDRDQPAPIYAHDLGPASNEHLRSFYSDRPVWIVAGPSVTGSGFEVIDGAPPSKETPK